MTEAPTVKARVIFVNRFAWPDHSATSQMLTDIAEGLASEGWQVTVVASRLRYGNPSTPLLPRHERHNGVDLVRVASSNRGRASLAGRAVDFASFYVGAFFGLLLLVRRGDILVAKTDPPLLQVPAMIVAKLRGARQVNWLQDLYPEVAAALGLRLFDGVLGTLLKRLRQISFRAARRNVAIGQRMAEGIAAEGAPLHSIRVIQNWAGNELTQREPDGAALREEWGLDGSCLVVGYSGNLGQAHEYQTMLDAAQLLEQDRVPVRFLFIGGGASRAKVEAAGTSALFAFQPYQPRRLLAESLAVADVQWLSLQPELEGMIVPSKFYGAAASGRPVIFIGDPEGEVARLIRQYNCGWAFSPGDAEGVAKLLRQVCGARGTLYAKGANARQAMLDHHTVDLSVAAWDRLLCEVAAEDQLQEG